MQCATHPSVETELACGKCGKPICPRCLVYTPVGTRCRDCANLRRLPQYSLSTGFLARAAAASLVAGLVLGGIWGFIFGTGIGFYFGLIVGLGIGYAIGEVVSIAANRKAGQPLQVIAAAGVIVAYLVRDVVLLSTSIHANISFIDLLRNDSFGYLTVALAIFVAVGRLR
jgi:hypothetical protein